jgi:CSLREA domain-containing protein
MAADFEVTTTADGDDKACNSHCTLREAVTFAGSDDRVMLPAGTYRLTMGELHLLQDEIVGAGARTTAIDGGGASRVLRVNEGTSLVSGVTIIRGNGEGEVSSGLGGGIFVQSGALQMNNSAVRNNTAERGGGIASLGTVILFNSTVSGNTASFLRVTEGGGIFVAASGALGLINATVSGNSASDAGGGTSSRGGGISSLGQLAVNYSTIANNTSANGNFFMLADPEGGTMSLNNSILAATTGDACAGSGIDALTAANNVADDASCAFKDPTNRNNANPALGPLANNGGQTDTHALLPASAAISAAGTCTTTDQRGVSRPQPSPGTCDSGAYEYRAPTLRVVTNVVNDAGGTRTPSQFTAHVREGGTDVKGSPQAGSAAGTTYVLDAGSTYSVAADAVAGYTTSVSSGCGSFTLQEGENRTCTITAEDVAPTLRVITQVANNEGGTLTPANFTARVRSGGIDVVGSPQPGSAAGTVYTLSAGPTYTVSADAMAGYSLAVTGSCTNGSITLALGQNATCTITASDNPPTLQVITNVVNDNGGTLAPGNFSAHVRAGANDVNGSPQAGTSSGTIYSLSAGVTYTVAADAVTGYAFTVSGDCAANGTITMALDQDRSCTITANDVGPRLTVVTNVVNDNGGTLAPGNFSAHVRAGATDVNGSPQPGSAAGTLYTLSASVTYTVAADAVTGYTFTRSGDCAANGTITMALGQVRTCTITANDVAPTLTVITQVTNDNGGTRQPSGFNVHVRTGGSDVATSPRAGSAAGSVYTLSAGPTYAVAADPVTGYTLSSAGDCSPTLQVGQNLTCTITANDVAPRLTVVTNVVNDNGGTRSAADFTAHVRTGGADVDGSPQPGSTTGSLYTLTAGTAYAVAADDLTGYGFALAGSCNVTLQVGDNLTCTITANDVAPTLRVVTNVTNDNGGTRAPSGFTLRVRNNGNVVGSGPGDANGTVYTLTGGSTYAVAADDVTGYTFSSAGGCSVTLQVGQNLTCTITANDVAPTLTVITTVANDAGGTLGASGVTAHVREGANDVPPSPQAGSPTGTAYTLTGGRTYTVAADAVSGYDFAVTGACAANGNVTPQVGQNLTCTIAGTDIAPTLTVVTNVENDAGGTLAPAGVTARVRQGATEIAAGPGSAAGTTLTLTAGPTYTVAGDAVSGYQLAITGACAANGNITLPLGQNRTCTITANDVAPTLRVITNVVNDDGGDLERGDVSVRVRRGATEIPGSPKPGTAAPGAEYTVIAGEHTVTADPEDGYSATYTGACAANGTITLALAQNATCTVTLDDGASTLEVATAVVNDDGGTATPADFNVSVRLAGVEIASQPGSGSGSFSLAGNSTYTLAAAGPRGYAIAIAGDCAPSDGSVTLPLSQSRSCTVTADDVAPRLTVVTQVVNDHGGAAGPGSFTVHVRRGGSDVAGSPQPGSGSGTAYTLEAGTHVVAADAVSGYGSAVSGDCAGDGSVTLAVGDSRTCTVTADDVPPPVAQPSVNAQQLPPPVAGKSVNALPKSGTVKVKLPGSVAYVNLEEAQQLPVGTVVDARKGHVTLVAAADNAGGTATAEFWAGIFRLGQTKGATPTTVLTLVEKLSCPRAGRASVAAKGKKKRRLWGDGSGKFRTKGKHSAATVVGTRWLVEDKCRSTLTRVVRGRVSVRDFVKKKTVIVRAGKKYVARAR